ncbi:MAG: hypothetical protein FRX49_07727 [Trebouxia sp. A1-2]|nr:MAG: hypothetical protein FRX49_07727 [Trebouxia sp. A1-2]
MAWPRPGRVTAGPVWAAAAGPCPMCDAAAGGVAEAADWSAHGTPNLAFGITLLIEGMAGCLAVLRAAGISAAVRSARPPSMSMSSPSSNNTSSRPAITAAASSKLSSHSSPFLFLPRGSAAGGGGGAVQSRNADWWVGFIGGVLVWRVAAVLVMIRKAARAHLNSSHLYPRLPVNHLEA